MTRVRMPWGISKIVKDLTNRESMDKSRDERSNKFKQLVGLGQGGAALTGSGQRCLLQGQELSSPNIKLYVCL